MENMSMEFTYDGWQVKIEEDKEDFDGFEVGVINFNVKGLIYCNDGTNEYQYITIGQFIMN